MRRCVGGGKRTERRHQDAPPQQQRADAAGDEHPHRRPHDEQQDVDAPAIGGKQPVLHQPRRHQHPGDDAADQHAGADAQPDDDPRPDAQQRHAESEAGARREVVDDERNRVADPQQRGGQEDQPRGHERAHHGQRRLARLGSVCVEGDERLAGRDAVRKRQVFVVDEVLAERHREKHAEQPRGRQPRPRLDHVRWTSKPLPGSAASRSKAASSQQRNATCPADVPAVCTTLFSQRL